MLTRLQVDGFKNLLGFDCYFGPYTCIAGPNSVGKSNIFDAIHFLALLADNSFLDAAQRLRGRGRQALDLKSLFWNSADSADPLITLAAEMIVPAEVEDDFGRIATPTTTFLRYELDLRYVPSDLDSPGSGGIRLEREELKHILKGQAHQRLPWPHSAASFRDAAVRGRRSGVAYVSTTESDTGEPVVQIHQDGGSRGKPIPSNPARAPRTAVSTTTSSDAPTILAARREMSGWRQLALEPSAMRSPDAVTDDPHMTQNGAHLAAALYRMARERGSQAYHEVTAAAAAITDIRQVAVDYDRRRDSLTLQAQIGTGPMLPARSLSDGTLRFLALCILKADDDDRVGRLFCMEEPENGIHPGRIEAMVDLTRSLVVDVDEPPGPANPMRQMIVNTHSPRFVNTVASRSRDDILSADPAIVSRNGAPASTIRLTPLTKTWRAERDPERAIPLEFLTAYRLSESDTLAFGDEDG